MASGRTLHPIIPIQNPHSISSVSSLIPFNTTPSFPFLASFLPLFPFYSHILLKRREDAERRQRWEKTPDSTITRQTQGCPDSIDAECRYRIGYILSSFLLHPLLTPPPLGVAMPGWYDPQDYKIAFPCVYLLSVPGD